MDKVYKVACHIAFWGVFTYGFTLLVVHMAHNVHTALASL